MQRLTALLLCLTLTACTVAPLRADYSLIDTKGVDMSRYAQEYNECASLANQTDVADRAAGGAVFGALLGAVIGGALCGRNCAASTAAWGAGSGALGGAGGGVQEQQNALRTCLAGRGYRVIR